MGEITMQMIHPLEVMFVQTMKWGVREAILVPRQTRGLSRHHQFLSINLFMERVGIKSLNTRAFMMSEIYWFISRRQTCTNLTQSLSLHKCELSRNFIQARGYPSLLNFELLSIVSTAHTPKHSQLVCRLAHKIFLLLCGQMNSVNECNLNVNIAKSAKCITSRCHHCFKKC